MILERTERIATRDVELVVGCLGEALQSRFVPMRRDGSTVRARRLEERWSRFRSDDVTFRCAAEGAAVALEAFAEYRLSREFWLWTCVLVLVPVIGWVIPPYINRRQKRAIADAVEGILARVKAECEQHSAAAVTGRAAGQRGGWDEGLAPTRVVGPGKANRPLPLAPSFGGLAGGRTAEGSGRRRGRTGRRVAVVAALGIAGLLLGIYMPGFSGTSRGALNGGPQMAGAAGAKAVSVPSATPERTVPVAQPTMGSAGEGGGRSQAAAETPAVVPAGAEDLQAQGAEIMAAVERWRRALLSNSSGEIAPSYASRVDRYFLRTNVDRAFVRGYMTAQEARGFRLTKYSLSDVTMSRMGDGAVEVRFVANFTVETPSGQRSGWARTALRLHREDAGWKIFYERDFRS